ncbi:YitT family protein [Herbiconiux sp. 11R-BC]|uniref:YitT family protein n=1 Tax=Herbiconiux sp. 11R-BC TaxID=3111637 RepID=UPI003BFF2AD7
MSDIAKTGIADRLAPRHTIPEDVLAVLAGTVTTSLGLFLLKTAGAVTGGTAGLSLLVGYATGVPFGLLFFAVNLPFFALALWKKGIAFTLRTVVAVTMISVFSALMPTVIGLEHLDPVYGALVGNLLAGVGMLILFRHGSSLGGFNILALILQERLGWRAGYVQMALDVAVVLASFAVVPPLVVLLSAAGAVVLNLVLALNHRPGRYRA